MITPTPRQMAGIYDMLRTFHPFNVWRLPTAKRVRFVTDPKAWLTERHARRLLGMHWMKGRRHTIFIAPHKTLADMVATMAHEMIHVHEAVNDVPCDKRNNAYIHGVMFQKIASVICSELGFNRQRF